MEPVDLRLLGDAELAARLDDADAGAFSILHARHYAAVLGRARSICKRPELAEEAVQETFLGFWRRPRGFDPARGELRHWLLAVVGHRSIDLVRRGQLELRHCAGSDELLHGIAASGELDDEVLRRETRRSIHAVMGELAEPQRQVVGLAYLGELTQTEIALRLGIPLGTVKSRTRLAYDRIGRRLAA
jgi:RNA polymerase sigma-70 factor (ECF subfamily)